MLHLFLYVLKAQDITVPLQLKVHIQLKGRGALKQPRLISLFVEEVNKIKKAHHMVWQILGTGPGMTNVLSQ